MDKTKIRSKPFYFSDLEKHQIIQEMLSTQCSRQAIWKKYTNRDQEHGKIVAWMRKFGYNASISQTGYIHKSTIEPMSKNKIVKPVTGSENEDFDKRQLKRRIAELERQLKEAELKAIAFSTMIDFAEKELKIQIRKKFNTKP